MEKGYTFSQLVSIAYDYMNILIKKRNRRRFLLYRKGFYFFDRKGVRDGGFPRQDRHGEESGRYGRLQL